ncbi:MAG: hypothetical protein IKM03_08395 [Alistipes sp.]|nr:hypothetical protein [Alistipes sp.]
MALNKILLIAIAVLSMLAVSCTNNVDEIDASSRTSEVTFTVSAIESITRADYGNGEQANNLYWAVYNHDTKELLFKREEDKPQIMTELKTKVVIPFVEGRSYDVLFWAENADAPYKINWSNATMEYEDASRLLANQENYDAFYCYYEVGLVSKPVSHDVELQRPFAQVNVLAANLVDMVGAGYIIDKTKVVTDGVYTAYDFRKDNVVGSPQIVTFNYASRPNAMAEIGSIAYNIISMNYLLVGQAKTTIDIEVGCEDVNGVEKTFAYSTVPVRQNFKTNIVLNQGAGEQESNKVYYNSLSSAFDDINRGVISGNATAAEAVVMVSKTNGLYSVALLKDTSVENTISLNNVKLILNGHTLSSTVTKMFAIGDNVTIDGRISGSAINYSHNDELGRLADISGNNNRLIGGQYIVGTSGLGRYPSSPEIMFDIAGELLVDGISLESNDKGGGTVWAFRPKADSNLTINNSTIIVKSASGLNSICVYSIGDITATDSRLEVWSNHTANAAGNDYAQTGRALYSEATSTVRLNNCNIYGAHSGGTFRGNLFIDGGIYRGYSHGGLYISNGASYKTIIKNAQIREEVSLPDGYYDDGVAGTNKAGMYTGAASNMKIYMDNCNVFGRAQPIVLKYTDGSSYNNALYVSNTSINKDYTHYGVRNDGSNYVYFGKNNNFDSTNLRYNRNYVITDADYGQIE